jgi:high affinity sulfate transporter 1
MRAKLARWLPGLALLLAYDRRWFGRDLAAGMSVAAVALPVGIAYASLAGVPAQAGIYAATFPLFAYALFGSSRQLMIGPDAATCIMVAASLAPLAAGDPERYVALVPVLTLITGCFYLGAGFAKLGFIASFLSQPILTGYLNGIALIIIVGQLPKLLGYPSTAGAFLPQLAELASQIGRSHWPTVGLGLALLVVLVGLRRGFPSLPAALVVVALGIVAVYALGLDRHGVHLTGLVPAGLPAFGFAVFDPETYRSLVRDAAGIMLISFTSGVLTAKSFAQRNRYDIDANQELKAFGAGNIAAALAQGFPVTGADSRTAVNNATRGQTQLVGIIAAVAMLLVLFFLTEPLALVPTTALAAVILVSAAGLFDFLGLRMLWTMTWREGLISIITTLGVLVLGVLQGVVLAVSLSLLWMLAMALRPGDAVLGRVEGLKGFHSKTDYPEARTVPGLILYRFNANIVFYNVDYFRERVLRLVRRGTTPPRWVVVDLAPVNIIDATALERFDALREELAKDGITLALAAAKRQLIQAFNARYVAVRRAQHSTRMFPTLKAAVQAFEEENPDVTAP